MQNESLAERSDLKPLKVSFIKKWWPISVLLAFVLGIVLFYFPGVAGVTFTGIGVTMRPGDKVYVIDHGVTLVFDGFENITCDDDPSIMGLVPCESDHILLTATYQGKSVQRNLTSYRSTSFSESDFPFIIKLHGMNNSTSIRVSVKLDSPR